MTILLANVHKGIFILVINEMYIETIRVLSVLKIYEERQYKC